METNAIYSGDCKDVLSKFPEKSVDLIYVDPPFFTQKNYEVIWDDGYEIRSFKDAQWYGKNGKRRKDIYVYLDWLRERIEQCYRVLKDTGTFYIHCDYHANSYIKVYILDKIFGRNNFRNEIIWKRTFHPKGSQFKDKKFGVYTDSILFYTKSNKYTFELEKVRIPLTTEELKDKYPKKDSKGNYLVYPILRSASKGERPNLVYSYKGYTPDKWGWVVKKEKLIEIDKRGDLGWNKRGTPFRKYRSWEDRGKPIGNLWDDIPRVGSGENLGYPTQKPLALMERIIIASSNPGDIVLDPMCGCGTTIAICQKFKNKEKRKWIGIDISPTACKLMSDRLRKLGASPKLIGMPATVKQLKKIQPFDFQNWVIQCLGGRTSARKVGDMGIDGVTFDSTPIQVKQSDKVGRNVVDNFETAIRRYFSGSKREKTGIIVAFSFTSGAYDEAHRVGLESDIKLELKTVEELLNET